MVVVGCVNEARLTVEEFKKSRRETGTEANGAGGRAGGSSGARGGKEAREELFDGEDFSASGEGVVVLGLGVVEERGGGVTVGRVAGVATGGGRKPITVSLKCRGNKSVGL